jgi:hypothetical protein
MLLSKPKFLEQSGVLEKNRLKPQEFMRLLVLHGIVVASAEKDCLSSAFDLDRDGIVSRLDLEYFLRREKFLSSET